MNSSVQGGIVDYQLSPSKVAKNWLKRPFSKEELEIMDDLLLLKRFEHKNQEVSTLQDPLLTTHKVWFCLKPEYCDLYRAYWIQCSRKMDECFIREFLMKHSDKIHKIYACGVNRVEGLKSDVDEYYKIRNLILFGFDRSKWLIKPDNFSLITPDDFFIPGSPHKWDIFRSTTTHQRSEMCGEGED